MTWKPTTGRPFRRAKPRTSAAPSPTSATSASFTIAAAAGGDGQVAQLRQRCWRAPSTRMRLLAAADLDPAAGRVEV